MPTDALNLQCYVTARAEGMSDRGARRFADHVTSHGMRDGETLLECYDRYVAGLDRLNYLLSMLTSLSSDGPLRDRNVAGMERAS